MFRDRFQRPLAATAICLAATALPLSAQETPAPSAQELANQKKIEELERKLAVLAEELQALRAGEKAEEAPAPAPGESAPEGATGLAPAASKVYSKQRGVSIGGYGEMVYENYDATRDDGEPSEARDRIDLLHPTEGIIRLHRGAATNDKDLFISDGGTDDPASSCKLSRGTG
jgi:hypothetical protein